jgi:ATP-dependent exoDNAse (exonuclease V) beta subunit
VTGGVAGGRQLGTQFHELVHRCLERRQIESAEEPMREWLYNALHTPLPQIGPVWDLPRHTIWSEMEFGLLEEGNILRGAMDLVIRHATGWYLIDWKTNQLPSYDAPALREAMERGHYLDQAQLYGRALQRWISQVAPGEKLAGVYYLFVRGPGVFHVGA